MGRIERPVIPDAIIFARAQRGRRLEIVIPAIPDYVSGTSGPGYIVRADLFGTLPDGLNITPQPVYPGGVDDGTYNDEQQPGRTWLITWTPSLEQCQSEVSPFYRRWNFGVSFKSNQTIVQMGQTVENPSNNTVDITFSIVADARSLVRQEIRGSEVGGPPEERYGEYPHWPIPSYRVNSDTGKVDAAAAIAVQYLHPPSIGRRTFDFAQGDDARNRQVFNLENGDLVAETFSGDEESAIPEQATYLIHDIDLHIDFTGNTMSYKTIHYIEPPDLSRELRVVPLGINLFGVRLGSGLAFGRGGGSDHLLVPIIPIATNRGRQPIYEVNIPEQRLGTRQIARGHGVVGAFAVLHDGKFYWNGDRSFGLAMYRFNTDLTDAPAGIEGLSRTHNRFAINPATGQTRIRRGAAAVDTFGQGVFKSLLSDGTSSWGVAAAHQRFVRAGAGWQAATDVATQIGVQSRRWAVSLRPDGPTEADTRVGTYQLSRPGGRTGLRWLVFRVPIGTDLATVRVLNGTEIVPLTGTPLITTRDGFEFRYVQVQQRSGDTFVAQVDEPDVWADANPRVYRLDQDPPGVGTIDTYTEMPAELGLSNPQAGAWFRERMVVANVEDDGDTTLHVINHHNGDAFTTPVGNITGRSITGMSVGFGGVLIGNDGLDIIRIAAFAAELQGPSKPPVPTVTTYFGDGVALNFENLAGYTYQLRTIGDIVSTLYSSQAPAEFGGYNRWANILPTKTNNATSIRLLGALTNTTYTMALRRIFLPNNADTDEGIPGDSSDNFTFLTLPPKPRVVQSGGTGTSWTIEATITGDNAGVTYYYRLARTAAAAPTAPRVAMTGATATADFTRANPQADHDARSYLVVEAQNASGAVASDVLTLRPRLAEPTYSGWDIGVTNIKRIWSNSEAARFPNAVLEVAVVKYSDWQEADENRPLHPAIAQQARPEDRTPTFNQLAALIETVGTNTFTEASRDAQNANIIASGSQVRSGMPIYIFTRLRETAGADAAVSEWKLDGMYLKENPPTYVTAGVWFRDNPTGTNERVFLYAVYSVRSSFDWNLEFGLSTGTSSRLNRTPPSWNNALVEGRFNTQSPYGTIDIRHEYNNGVDQIHIAATNRAAFRARQRPRFSAPFDHGDQVDPRWTGHGAQWSEWSSYSTRIWIA